MCVLNGRIDVQKDNFTYISGRGKSVVDYICVPHDVLEQLVSFEVITTCSIVEQSNLFSLLGERSKVPDHSVLTTEFKTNCTYSTKSQVPQECVENKRYKLKSIPNDLFASDLSKIALQSIITQIERTRKTQTHIDEIYSKLCDIIIDEMNPTF
ncbi:HMGCR [Mytilus edulis]|uniref:HMGCR n=1 Tax=Mytilus edulis TaxID=6550 RepID=A0A8S3Q659_MYTED|nr:HMGCR [Mytilus edulis]